MTQQNWRGRLGHWWYIRTGQETAALETVTDKHIGGSGPAIKVLLLVAVSVSLLECVALYRVFRFARSKPNCALKFSITEGVFAESAAGRDWDEKEIRIQSDDDQLVTVLAVAANRQKEWTQVSTIYGEKKLPLCLKFGDTIYAGSFSEVSHTRVLEVLIRTDRGDFTSRNIKHESTQRLRPNAPRTKSFPPGSF